MAIWNYRGALDGDWGDRKYKLRLSINEVVKLGIETAESKTKVAKLPKIVKESSTGAQVKTFDVKANKEVRKNQDPVIGHLNELGFSLDKIDEWIKKHGKFMVGTFLREGLIKIDQKKISDIRAFLVWNLDKTTEKPKENLLSNAIQAGIEKVLASGMAIGEDQYLLLSPERQLDLSPRPGEDGAMIFYDLKYTKNKEL